MIDAATLSTRLAECKRRGMEYDAAWRECTGQRIPLRPRKGHETSPARFAYLTFKAHYEGEDCAAVALSADLAADPDDTVAARGASRP